MNQRRFGKSVSWFDEWRRERQSGIIIDVRRSSRNPWRVAIVRLQDGRVQSLASEEALTRKR